MNAQDSSSLLATADKAHGAVLEFHDVSYRYGNSSAVEHVSLRIERGDFTAIVGPNGSGKTTLLRLGLGLLRPTEGQVSLMGVPVAAFRDWSRVGYVPQVSTHINERFPITVSEVVSQGHHKRFSPRSFWRKARSPAVRSALQTVGAEHLADRRIGLLSGGELQRVLVARSLVGEPELLVLDEPSAGFDIHGEEQLNALLRRLNENGTTVLIVSHDIGAVMREAETCCCINKSVKFHGQPHDLTQSELAELYGFPVEVLLHDALHEHR